jgi:hypothetical protein
MKPENNKKDSDTNKSMHQFFSARVILSVAIIIAIILGSLISIF